MTTEVAGGVSFTLLYAGSESYPIKTVTRGSDFEDGPDGARPRHRVGSWTDRFVARSRGYARRARATEPYRTAWTGHRSYTPAPAPAFDTPGRWARRGAGGQSPERFGRRREKQVAAFLDDARGRPAPMPS